MNIFRILTPVTYWLLVVMWAYILIFLMRRLSFKRMESKLINMLIIILSIDALRTLFESLYFGAWYTSLSGFLPIAVHDFLIRSEIVFIPKLMNLIAAILIILILFRKWFPAEENDRQMLNMKINEHPGKLEEKNKQLEVEIAEREQAQVSLRESESLLMKIAENYPNSYLSIIEKDLTCGFTSGQEFAKLGLNPNDFIGLSLKDVFGELESVVKEHYLKTFAGEEQVFELFINDQHQKYTTAPLPNEKGEIDRILSVVQNITEQKKAEAKLKGAELKLRALFEQSGGIFMILDPNTPDGIPLIIDANKAACTAHGYTRDEFIGLPISDIDDENDIKLIKQRVIDIMAGNPLFVEMTHVRKDGSKFSVSVNAIRIDIDGEPPMIFATEYDISESKRNEEEIKTKTRELEEQFDKSEKQRVANLVILSDLNKTTTNLKQEVIERQKAEDQVKRDLKEKNTLLQELYHRTKNNMQVISSMLRMEARRSNSPDLQASFKEITGKINTMALVHQKLYQAKDLSRIDLSEYIYDLSHLITRGYGYQADNITFKYDMQKIFVLIDTVMPLGLVLNELITNAFKHAFPNKTKGEIHIEMDLDADDVINIYVSDNGVGITKTTDLRKSKSMGLQTMYSLVEHQLQGKVDYNTKNGLKWHIEVKDTINTERV